GRRAGLVDDVRWEEFERKRAQKSRVVQLLAGTRTAAVADEIGAVSENPTLGAWLRRPESKITQIERWIARQLGEELARGVLATVETETKYEGYLNQQKRHIVELSEAENRRIPEGFAYSNIPGLSNEVRQKLARVRPTTLGQARRIPGVTPAAISVLDIYLSLQMRTSVLHCST
ncbi:MAG: hypothetical protein JO270_18245, partial [Acidobacteriaceae bacterium]|nr:hypothetical protein [Acidobacteriaceae bacterium]